MSDYWNHWWTLRSNRRRFLQAGATTGIGAAGIALVGCGDDDDDDDDGDASTNTPGGLAPTATAEPDASATPTPSITRGGEFIYRKAGDPPSINPYGSTSFEAKNHAGFVYSRLFKPGTGPGLTEAEILPAPDAAEDYEFIDDLTVSVKLRPDVMFHDVAPVNGRQMTTEDVEYSWGLATAPENANASRFSNVESVEFSDDLTMTFKLSAPDAEFIEGLSDANLLWLMPKEADGGFDPATTMIGSGPWLFSKYEPSVEVVYDRNPNWFAGENGMYPILDRWTYKLIPEYANALAQFIAGNLSHLEPNNNDLPQIVEEVADVGIRGETRQLVSFFYWSTASDPNTAWGNPMVRQAISMAVDRDASFDLYANAKELTDAGFELDPSYNTMLPAGMKRWWLDPQGSGYGDAAKFYTYDPTEARALLSAAGYDDPGSLSFKYQYTANRYGSGFNSVAEANLLFMQDIGVNPEVEIQDYNAVYFSQTFAGNFTGLAFGYETPFPTVGGYPQRMFTDNSNNHSKVDDADLRDLTSRQQQELDEEARRDLLNQIQVLNAERGYYFGQQAGAGTRFNVFQKNASYGDVTTLFGSYGDGTEEYPYWWIDPNA